MTVNVLKQKYGNPVIQSRPSCFGQTTITLSTVSHLVFGQTIILSTVSHLVLDKQQFYQVGHIVLGRQQNIHQQHPLLCCCGCSSSTTITLLLFVIVLLFEPPFFSAFSIILLLRSRNISSIPLFSFADV